MNPLRIVLHIIGLRLLFCRRTYQTIAHLSRHGRCQCTLPGCRQTYTMIELKKENWEQICILSYGRPWIRRAQQLDR